jgi:hypothetical protein
MATPARRVKKYEAHRSRACWSPYRDAPEVDKAADVDRGRLLPRGNKMGIELLPEFVRENYEVHEWKHACAILKGDFPEEWTDICDVLNMFRLKRSWIEIGGGSKSAVSREIDSFLYKRGWEEKTFETQVVVDDTKMESPTHKIDCYKNRVALEIEWNNKDPFYDRDLNNFRLLFDLRAISVGVIMTRSDELQRIFEELGRGKSYGASTTHISKLLPRVQGGSGGGCPLLVLGITEKLYVKD